MICGHAPQSGRSLVENSLFDELKGEWDMHSAGDLVMCLGKINGHVGRHTDGFRGVRCKAWCREEEFGMKNVTRVFLENKLHMSNTWHKREEKRKVAFREGEKMR